MVRYVPSKFKAVAKDKFLILGDDAGVFPTDSNGELNSEEACEVSKGYEMDYFFTRYDGWHFVHHDVFESGFWVRPELISVEPK